MTRRSIRLGAIPDPLQLRETPTASFDELERRIYGKPHSSSMSSQSDGVSPKTTSSPIVQQRGRTPPGAPADNVNILLF